MNKNLNFLTYLQTYLNISPAPREKDLDLSPYVGFVFLSFLRDFGPFYFTTIVLIPYISIHLIFLFPFCQCDLHLLGLTLCHLAYNLQSTRMANFYCVYELSLTRSQNKSTILSPFPLCSLTQLQRY
jgi:hypothetical protein